MPSVIFVEHDDNERMSTIPVSSCISVRILYGIVSSPSMVPLTADHSPGIVGIN